MIDKLPVLLRAARSVAVQVEDDRGRPKTVAVDDTVDGLGELVQALRVGPPDPDQMIMGYPVLRFAFLGQHGTWLAGVSYLHSNWLYWPPWGRDRPLLDPARARAWLTERNIDTVMPTGRPIA